MAEAVTGRSEGFVLDGRPVPWGRWLADIRAHSEVFWVLVRKDFQTRFKRASLGVLWAVAVPVLQGLLMAYVFAKVVRFGSGDGFAAYVMSGILPWSYFGGTVGTGVTTIVDGSGLTDKVWFPRILLVGVPVAANLVGLVISMSVLLAVGPLVGVEYGVRLLLLLPAMALLVALAFGFSLVLSALHVYFRDTKFVVGAAMLVWLYVTPIVYRRGQLGILGDSIDFNPVTGIIALFHQAIGQEDVVARPLAISAAMTVALVAVGLAAQRRHDRLFVDRL
jgi:ABC-type polysaccharide/polyol phosphate export permease